MTEKTKKILNRTARALNLKIDNKALGRCNIQLSPGYNIVTYRVWKALKALDFCKNLVEDDKLDFSPKEQGKKKLPEKVVDPRIVSDPSKKLGPKKSEEEEEEEKDE